MVQAALGLPAHVGNMHTVVHPACPDTSRRTSKRGSSSCPIMPRL
jgi:hypothetical protein